MADQTQISYTDKGGEYIVMKKDKEGVWRRYDCSVVKGMVDVRILGTTRTPTKEDLEGLTLIDKEIIIEEKQAGGLRWHEKIN